MNIDEALKAYGGKVGLSSEQLAHLSKWCTAASFSGGMLGLVAGVSDFMEGDILNGIGNTACGVSALTSETTCRVSSRLLQIYQGSKVLSRISDATGVIGGAVTTFNGIVDSFHAFENNDGWSRVSGLAEIGAGGAAMYAGIYSLAMGAACPPALIAAAIFMGIYLGVEHFNPNK